jgi:hypothetical protein
LLEPLFARSDPASASLRQTAFGIWLHRHPAAVAAWALTAHLPAEGDTRLHLARQAGLFWAGQDAVAATAWAESIPDPALSNGVLEMILPTLAKTDPSRALALAHAGGPEFFAKIEDALFQNWAETDPEAALRELGPAMFARAHNYKASRALGAWLALDPAAAMTWFSNETSFNAETRNQVLQDSFHSALYAAGDNAGSLLDSLTAAFPELRGHRVNFLVNWYGQSPDAARAWLQRLPDAAARADLVDGMIPKPWPANLFGSPERFLDLALLLPDGPRRDEHLSHMSSEWLRLDPVAASAWLDAQGRSDPAFARAADRAGGAIIAALAETDPAAAVASYDALPEGGEARRAAAPDLALAWARSDPSAALRWLADKLLAVPPETSRELLQNVQDRRDFGADSPPLHTAKIISPALLRWSQQDPLAALRWAEEQRDPVWREVALSALATFPNGQFPGINQPTYAAPDPVARAELLGRIAAPAERQTHLAAHLANWLARDYASARTWIEDHDSLSPEIAARLLAEHAPLAP